MQRYKTPPIKFCDPCYFTVKYTVCVKYFVFKVTKKYRAFVDECNINTHFVKI